MSELQQRKRPWYTEDILYIIAEKLLARIPSGYGPSINFCQQNPYTLFMSHNEMAMRTVISQFAKFKKINFTKSSAIIGHDYEKQIQFYKNDSFSLYGYGLQSEEFGGPYYVPPGMLEYIIEKGKLRVTTINSSDFLRDDHSIDIKEFGEMNSLKAFCALFLAKQVQIPDGLNNNFLVEKFCIHEQTESIQNNFEAILAIDAVELELDIANMHTNLIDCSQYNSPIIAQNTTKITIFFTFDVYYSKEYREKFATNFETFCHFIARVCPALKHLHIKILSCSSFKSIDASPDEFIENLHSTIKAMESSIKSINIGNEQQLEISIKLTVSFIPWPVYDKLPIQSHDLFKLGSPFTTDDKYVHCYAARSLDCVDVLGRIHKLLFKIVKFNWYDLLNLFGIVGLVFYIFLTF